ncbi:hypothetical protein C5B94_13630 [Clavibacter michiganensis]|uniref:DUF2510 domain-containing protein n=1 Tax=Clavibacter michiganensis TaxID=28447 RepID=UPI000CE88734|nr:DUF2510 domain-containing protein [Clavibacter michiganensis]PPF52135.1 hypothetical protein C5B94_13630 [Clavibacter michiganensis]
MPAAAAASASAGWFPDGSGQLCYWDGSAWTQHVALMVHSAVSPARRFMVAQKAFLARAATGARTRDERVTVTSRARPASQAETCAQGTAKITQRAAVA